MSVAVAAPPARTRWAWLGPAAGAAVLAVVVARLGSGPFLRGLAAVDSRSLLLAALLTAATTSCSAGRWAPVARGLGAPLPLRTAFAAYYRSQFLNSVLPAGVLGDLDRGLRHGRRTDGVVRGLRAVAWERAAGQAVQVAAALVVLRVARVPGTSTLLGLLAVALAAVTALVLAARGARAGRVLAVLGTDLRHGLLTARVWPGVVGLSVLTVAGHLGVFVLAARTAGVGADAGRLVVLGMLALVAMAVPVNLAGWGPREGVAAWSFAAAGLGAEAGVATATAFGVLALAATLPGAVLVVLDQRRPARSPHGPGGGAGG